MLHRSSPEPARRRFLVRALAGAGTTALWLSIGAARAQSPAAATGGALPPVSPSEPLAKSLGYTEDATHVDRARFPTYKPGQMCDKCRFYQGKAGQARGPCQIFMGKSVNAHGWCASFAVKT